MKDRKKAGLLFLTTVITFVVVFSFPSKAILAEDSADDIENDIESIEKKIKKEENAKAALEAQLAQIQNSVSATQAQIDKARALIKESEEKISRMEKDTKHMEERLDFLNGVLKTLIQQIYTQEKEPLFSIAIFKDSIGSLFGKKDSVISVEEKMLETVQEIKETKEKMVTEQEKIGEAKEDHEEILKSKVVQQYGLLEDRAEKQGNIDEKEATLSELQQKLAELQSDLSVLTGKSYNAKDIKEAVEYASSKTGVPKGVLYGFLKMETNLGANTGQCTYKEVEKVAVARYKKYGSKYKNSIALLYKRQELFYDLVDDLGYSKNKKVSCSPSGYIGQGGAMGIPQFMSDVWNSYSSRIRANTGHKNPDPWDLTDGVMAMALKLKSAGATSDSASAIKKASINYLGTFYANYYNGIVYWSKNYKKLFD